MVVPMPIPSHDCANLSCTSACGKFVFSRNNVGGLNRHIGVAESKPSI